VRERIRGVLTPTAMMPELSCMMTERSRDAEMPDEEASDAIASWSWNCVSRCKDIRRDKTLAYPSHSGSVVVVIGEDC
jgi:hypothetical protein